MVRIIIINTSGDLIKGVKTLNRMKKRFPRMTILGMIRWGRILTRHMKNAVRNAGIQDFSGTLQGKGIRWEQGPRTPTGYLFIRLHGIYLDGMKPHYVNVNTRRTRLLMWAKTARNSRIRQRAHRVEKKEIRKFPLFVERKPFIAQGYRTARPKLRPVLKRVAQRAIHAS
jgi:hypothetical protein